MDEGGLAPWICCILLILFADYIAIAETSLASVSKTRMKTLSEHGNKKAEKVLNALEHFDRTISTVLVCTNIAHLTVSTIVTVQVTRLWGLGAVTASTLITTLVVFFFAEMLPKSIAKKYSETLALWSIDFLTVLNTIFTPVSAVLSAIGNLAGRLTKGEEELSVTEDELYDIIEDMTEKGTLDEEQGDLISSALQFNDLTAESILTPRVDVVAIDINATNEEILDRIKNQNHSRLPVYEGTIDNIIGVLRIRNYIKRYLQYGSDVHIRKLLDEPLFVTESVNVNELLPMMTKKRQNLAIVTDHYGGTVGIVTVEDIMETLVGEIWDEDDVVEEPITWNEDGRLVVDAEETVGDVLDELDMEPSNDEDETELVNKRVGEWVYEHFSEIPKVTDSFEYEGATVTVAKMDHNRIRKVVFTPPVKEEETAALAQEAEKSAEAKAIATANEAAKTVSDAVDAEAESFEDAVKEEAKTLAETADQAAEAVDRSVEDAKNVSFSASPDFEEGGQK